MQHGQAFVHKHIHLGRQNMHITVKVEELLQQQCELPGKVQAMAFANLHHVHQDVIHIVLGLVHLVRHIIRHHAVHLTVKFLEVGRQVFHPNCPVSNTYPDHGIGHAIKVTHHRSEEHTSELQSRPHLVCRLLLEKKNPIP